MTSDHMREPAEWHCTTRSEHLNDWAADIRREIHHAAQRHQWETLLDILTSGSGSQWVNAVHLDDSSFDTPLHEVARGGATEYVAKKLIELKAFRAIRNAQGHYPIDAARIAGQTHLYSILEPNLDAHVSPQELVSIQTHFYALIHERVPKLGNPGYQSLRLPELEPLLDTNISEIWTSIPGMYGGFRYWLEIEENAVKVLTESHSRIVGGSEQRHEIDRNGFRLVAAGYWDHF